MPRLRIHFLAWLLAIALVPAAAADVLIGAAGPKEGPSARIGSDIARAARLAAERINADGGVLGAPIAVVEADDGCAEKKAEEAARALVARGVALVVGHPCASAATAAARIYAGANVLFIAPATRHPALTDQRAGPAVFRLAGRDDRQGASAGAFLARTFGTKPLAVVHDGSRYAAKLIEEALSALKRAGRKDVLTAVIAGGQKDYASLIAKLGAAHTDALLFAGFPIEGGLFLKQLRTAGLKTVFVGSDTLATSQLAETAGADATGAGVLLPHDPARTLAIATLRQTFAGESPTGPFLSAYAAIEVWRAAVREAQSLATEAVSGALQRGSFDTVLGSISFDDRGDANVPSYDVLWWKDGAWRSED